jgi:hypothetical protein
MNNPDRRRWIVTLSGERPVDAVADDVKAAGLEVRDVLAFTGTIVGEGTEATAEQLRGVAGVQDVSPDLEVNIGPPDAKVW